jgi:hypothetical protein
MCKQGRHHNSIGFSKKVNFFVTMDEEMLVMGGKCLKFSQALTPKMQSFILVAKFLANCLATVVQ